MKKGLPVGSPFWRLQRLRVVVPAALFESHSTALTISSTTFLASPKTIMVLSM
jgi:hypothetical protein